MVAPQGDGIKSARLRPGGRRARPCHRPLSLPDDTVEMNPRGQSLVGAIAAPNRLEPRRFVGSVSADSDDATGMRRSACSDTCRAIPF
jgi:hypothetical protein